MVADQSFNPGHLALVPSLRSRAGVSRYGATVVGEPIANCKLGIANYKMTGDSTCGFGRFNLHFAVTNSQFAVNAASCSRPGEASPEGKLRQTPSW